MSDAITREQLQATLQTRTSSMGALAAGAQLAGRTALIGLPAALVFGAISGALGSMVLDLAQASAEVEPATLELVAQVLTLGGVLAAVYGLIQFAKRDRVSRQSWWPSLFAVPLLLMGGACYLQLSGQAKQYGPVVLTFVLLGWGILYASFAGAAAAIVWLRAGNEALEGRPIRPGAILSEAGARLLEVAGPHGARVHAVTIGAQLLLPGIFYALQYAFTDALAVLAPDKAALARSGQLTFGMKGRLFRVLLVWWVAGMLLSVGAAAVLQGATTSDKLIELVTVMMIDPSAITTPTFVAQDVIWAVLTWILSLAMLVLYREREAQVRAKTELKKLDAAAAANQLPGVSGSEAG